MRCLNMVMTLMSRVYEGLYAIIHTQLKVSCILIGRESCSPNVPPPDIANYLRWLHDSTTVLFRLFYLLYVQVKDKTSVITGHNLLPLK